MKKIIKELERFYCRLTDYFFLTENFVPCGGQDFIGQFERQIIFYSS